MAIQDRAHADKAAIYAAFNNFTLLDVVRRVLPESGRVLDVGCASGGLLEHLGAAAGYRAGVELNPVAAAAARAHADDVFTCAIDDPTLDLSAHAFDVIVCADVLEHVADPAAALQRIATWCRPGGAVVICVPNIANWIARLRLLRGVWKYEDCGIWDDTHLRFFTLATLRELVQGAGMRVERIESTQALRHQLPRLTTVIYPAWRLAERIVAALARVRPQVFAFQLIAVARVDGG